MDVFVVTGREAILAHAGHLEELAVRCGQPGQMYGLRLLLGSRYAIRKRPCLVCFHSVQECQEKFPPLEAAVLLLEYCVAGLGTRLFASADSFGVRTVVAPEHLRSTLAAAASQAMLQRGGRIVLVSFKQQAPSTLLNIPAPYLYATQRRQVQDTLPLQATLEETLTTLGKRTRVHMRAVRRRFDRTFPHAVFVDASSALASLGTDELRRMNEGCLDTINQSDFDHQVRSMSQAGSFVLGLQNGDRWLALVAGWRQGGAAWVEWQINASGFEKLSLGSVLRSYLLEHEAAIGMRHLSFHGGTSHSMAHSFLKQDVVDLLARRPGIIGSLVVTLAQRVVTLFPRLRQRGNFLLDALASPLTWTSQADGKADL